MRWRQMLAGNLRRCTFVLLALAIVSTQAQAYVQQTAGSHITIETCYPHKHTAGQRHAWIDPSGTPRDATLFRLSDAFLAIDYRNEAKIPAVEIVFALMAGHTILATVGDQGVFSGGVTIRHEFAISQQVLPVESPHPHCAVLRVKYSDGTSWYNAKLLSE